MDLNCEASAPPVSPNCRGSHIGCSDKKMQAARLPLQHNFLIDQLIDDAWQCHGG